LNPYNRLKPAADLGLHGLDLKFSAWSDHTFISMLQYTRLMAAAVKILTLSAGLAQIDLI